MAEPSDAKVILLVDDEPLILIDMEDRFVDAGFDVLTASNADEALRLLTEFSDIGLVVTDVEMPGSMNGLGLMHVIKKRWPPVRIVIASSRSNFQPGAIPEDVPLFSKPVAFDRLYATVRQLLA